MCVFKVIPGRYPGGVASDRSPSGDFHEQAVVSMRAELRPGCGAGSVQNRSVTVAATFWL